MRSNGTAWRVQERRDEAPTKSATTTLQSAGEDIPEDRHGNLPYLHRSGSVELAEMTWQLLRIDEVVLVALPKGLQRLSLAVAPFAIRNGFTPAAIGYPSMNTVPRSSQTSYVFTRTRLGSAKH